MKETINIPVSSVKYKIPGVRANYIIRKKLMEKLEQLQEKSVTIIKAGAGSGKTTLLSVYRKEHELTAFHWINIDASMNHVCVFWKYVFGALEKELQDTAEGLNTFFEDSIQKDMLTRTLELFAVQITEEHPVYLVLDDYHTIQNPEITETMNHFIQMVPANVHLIFSTRTIPELDLGSLYMENKLLMLNDEDLRLSQDECKEFLTHTLGIRNNQEQKQWIEKMIHDANGWIGGAQLLAISGHELNSEYSVFTSADERVIYDYIKKEIFLALSEEEQQFLLKTAVLSYFNEEICERYLPEYNFVYMMKNISDQNLFVIVIDEQQKEYRYHAIMREFLLHVLMEHPDRKVQLYHKAADILYELRDYDECVRLLFEIHDYDTLMEKLLHMPQNVTTFSYMMQVPREQITKNVNFAYQYLFCHYAALELDTCAKIFEEMKQHLGDDKTFQAFAHANLFFNMDLDFQNVSILTYEQIQAMPLNMVTKAYLLIKEAYFLFIADHYEDAILYLNHAEEIYNETHNIYILSFVLSEKTQLLEEFGDLNEALLLYEKMEKVVQSVPTMKCSYYIGIAGVHIRQMKLDLAGQELSLARDLIDQNQSMKRDIMTISSAYRYTLAEWYYLTYDSEQAFAIIKDLSKDDVYRNIYFLARLLRYPIYRENNQKMAEQFIKDYEHTEHLLKNMNIEILYIGILYELGETKKALEQLNLLLARARKISNRNKIIEGSLMKARFLYDQNQEDISVVNLMKEALNYAVTEEIRTPFWFEKKFLNHMIKENDKQLRQSLTAKEITYMKQVLQEQDTSVELPYGLTRREVEVLDEMVKGSSNKQIADSLCISLATVKTHLINIYSKLGVANRITATQRYLEIKQNEL